MISKTLNEIDFREINEGPVIYQIRNVFTGRVFIASSMNFKKHLKGMISNIEKTQPRNPDLMNSDFSTYGINSFVLEILKDKGLTKSNITKFKESFLSKAKRLYNIKQDSTGGGYEILSEPCYLLNLEGEIEKEFPSVQSAFKSLNTTPNYAGKNTQSIINGKYRIVTIEFYKYHKAEILRWPKYSDLTKYLSQVYKKSTIIEGEIRNKKFVVANVAEAAKKINRTKEYVRLVLKNGSRLDQFKLRYVNEDAREEFKKLKEMQDTERKRRRIERKLRKMA